MYSSECQSLNAVVFNVAILKESIFVVKTWTRFLHEKQKVSHQVKFSVFYGYPKAHYHVQNILC